MKFLKSKFLTILIIFIIIIITGGLISKYKINQNLSNYINNSEIFPKDMIIEKIQYKIFSIKNEIEISNIVFGINLSNDEKPNPNNQIQIPITKIEFNFFSIFKSIFNKKPEIKKITFEKPNLNFIYNQESQMNFFNLIKKFEKINILIEITDGYIKIQNKDNSITQSFDKINGNINFNSINSINSKISFINQDNISKISLLLKNLKKNIYDFKISLKDQNNSLIYNSNFETNDSFEKINLLNGDFNFSGSNIFNFINFFCPSCKNNFCTKAQNQKILNNNLKFKIHGNTKINEENHNLLIIDNLKINIDKSKNENQIEGVVIYDFLGKKLYTNFSSNSLDLRNQDLDEQNNSKETNIIATIEIIKNLFNTLKIYNSENILSFKEISLNHNLTINNFNSNFLINDSKTKIRNFDVEINKIYSLKISNNISQNDNFNLIIQKNQMNFFELNAFFIDSDLIIKNFQLTKINDINQNQEKISGQVKFKNHNKSNFISGDLIFKNINFEQSLISKSENQNVQIISSYFDMKNNKNGGDFIKKILFLIEKYNIFYDLNCKFENFTFNSYNLENFNLKTFIKNNKIQSFINGKNSFADFQINSLIMFRNFKPYIELEAKIENFSFNAFQNKIFTKNIFLNEEEFKKNNNQNIWRNFDFNLNIIKNLDAKINLDFQNSQINHQKIDNIKANILIEDNVIKINDSNFLINKDSNLQFSGKLEIEKMIFQGSLETQNFNYRNFFKTSINSQNNDLFISNINLTSIGKFSTSGNNFHDFIQNLNGNIKFYGENIILNKINIKNFINEFDNAKKENRLISLAEQSVVSAESIINEINGDISIRNNIIENSFNFSGENFNGAGSFNMFLKNFAYKGLLRFVFASQTNDDVLNFFNLDINGNFFNINKNIDIRSIKQEKRT